LEKVRQVGFNKNYAKRRLLKHTDIYKSAMYEVFFFLVVKSSLRITLFVKQQCGTSGH
jgi:hypothetical protein